jgi:hypothetical protein
MLFADFVLHVIKFINVFCYDRYHLNALERFWVLRDNVKEYVFATTDSPVIFDGQFTSIMSEPREVARRGWAWRKSDDAHAHEHYAVAKHCVFHIYRPTSSYQRVVCSCMWLVTDKDSSGTQTDSGTDTEDVESCVPNFVSLLCR